MYLSIYFRKLNFEKKALKNNHMKRILVPTDFSKQSEVALKVAGFIAANSDIEIYILHSIEMPVNFSSVSTGTVPESIFHIKLAENKFEELLEKPYLEDLEVHEAIGHAEVYLDINEVVKERDIDLIIIGSHGISGFKEMFVGTNTEKVVSSSNVPVMVIKNEHESFNINNFVFLIDFSEDGIVPYKKALKFSKQVGVELKLLYVNTPSDFKSTDYINHKKDNFVNEFGLENHTFYIYNDSSIENGALNFAKENRVDLIGLGTHGRKGFFSFFNSSNISEGIVNHANMPVISFRY